MKKILASLVLTGLILASITPALAGYWDRAPVKENCVIGQAPDGSLIFEVRTISCLPSYGTSCLPEICLLPY